MTSYRTRPSQTGNVSVCSDQIETRGRTGSCGAPRIGHGMSGGGHDRRSYSRLFADDTWSSSKPGTAGGSPAPNYSPYEESEVAGDPATR